MHRLDHRSFRDQLAFSIGFAVSRSRDLLRRLLKEHVADNAREQLAERVIDHLELSGFEIDEGEQVMRKRPRRPATGSPLLRSLGRGALKRLQFCLRVLKLLRGGLHRGQRLCGL